MDSDSSTATTAVRQTKGRLTILVVDDFDDTRFLLRTWLERKGFRVIEAQDGLQAVSAAANSIPDLIIMDLEMPGMDGLSATRKIREVEALRRIPVVAVSAYGADQFRSEALAAGCNEYVSTPFEPNELELLIRSLLPDV
jgi:CheY-like chemotaxis protein